MMIMGQRIVIFGASRGLGKALALQLLSQDENMVLLSLSREAEAAKNDPQFLPFAHRIKAVDLDFTADQAAKEAYQQLILFRPHKFFYLAGGGPYGAFHKKQWKDHDWALRLNFLFVAELLHMMMRDWQRFHELRQLIVTGSAIAEDKADPFASSYSAGKHALIGLIKSIQAENLIPVDLRVFSPAYMDTEMLPPQATPRKNGSKIFNPVDVATALGQWVSDTQLRNQNFQLK